MIYLIAALSKNRQIGINHQMPWHIPEDLNYFKTITSGHTILMGRKTFETIGHPLPNRRNIVLTTNKNFIMPGVEVIHTLEEALRICQEVSNIFIIGGGQIYKAFLPYADQLYLTLIHKSVVGDTSFPEYHTSFKCISSIPGKTTMSDGTPFTFTIWSKL